MNTVSLGCLLCLGALFLLHRQQVVIGLFLFVVGIILMYGGRWPRR
jgi:hypothetical protein